MSKTYDYKKTGSDIFFTDISGSYDSTQSAVYRFCQHVVENKVNLIGKKRIFGL